MALTMTRTRTQTTLTKLAEMVANVHGELAFVERLRAQDPVAHVDRASTPEKHTQELRERFEARLSKLAADRDALYATVRQFDARIDPSRIGVAEEWRKRFGTGNLGTKTLAARYFATGQ